jgi:hypothetical protein
MSIAVHRAILTAAGAAVLTLSPAPGLAQADRNIQPDCAKIEDPAARLACYDNKNRNANEVVASPVPLQRGIPQGGGAPVATGGVASARGESARSPQRPAAATGQLARMTPIVAAAVERSPGAYLMTMADGAQWEFAEDMEPTYRAPERGARVEIERGVLGNFRMRFDDQQPVRVRRVR